MTLAAAPEAGRASPNGAPRTDRVTFLVGQNAHRVLHHITAEWVEAMQSLGQPAMLLDVSGPAGIAPLSRYLAEELPRAFVAFSGVGADLQSNGQCLFEYLDVPYVALLFDHPAYFPERHATADAHHAFLFSDADHLAASRAISPPGAIRGSFRFGCRPPDRPPLALAERDIPLLYAKAGGDPAQVRTYWAALPRALRRIQDDVLEVALWSDETPLWDLVARRVADDGIVSGFERTTGFLSMVMSLDTYIRRVRATRLLQALLRYPVLVVGGDWAHVDRRGSRATFRPPCELPELLDLVDRTQVLVNLHPNNRFAPHERLIYGLQRECLVVSEASDHLTADIGAGRFARIAWDETLEDRIADAMRDPAGRQDAVSEAGAYARRAWSVVEGARSVLRAIDTHAGLIAP